MQEFRLRFKPETLLMLTPAGQPAMRVDYDQGMLRIGVYYDVDPRPLTLQGAALPQDRAEVWIRPHRIELWVNGRQLDEEWPAGKHSLDGVDWEESGIAIESLPEEDGDQPAVIGEFVNAEGWQPEENVFVGDCMPYCDGERYHVLYLKDRHHHRSKWGKGAHQWAHISTKDMVHWQQHPMAVAIDEPWEGSICTGSWIAHDGKQYLFYTVRTFDGSPAPLRRSVSEDGYHFAKDPGFSFCLSERYWGASARDPKVVRASDGTFHMFVTTSLMDSMKGCLAHLVSADLNAWTELDPIYVAPDRDQPECPDYFEKDGWYYLIFSHHAKGQYRYSREPFSGWQCPPDPEIPCKSVPKMALWRDRILFCGFDGHGHYGGTMTFLEMHAGADGILV